MVKSTDDVITFCRPKKLNAGMFVSLVQAKLRNIRMGLAYVPPLIQFVIHILAVIVEEIRAQATRSLRNLNPRGNYRGNRGERVKS